MLGRTLVPLTFSNDEREIVIRDIGTLREIFKKEFYAQLVAYLHNRRLERFFFALGMDEIKETIEKLRDSGESDLEIINKIAELIGAEPISIEISDSLNFVRHSNLLYELTDTDQELRLILSSYFLRASELHLTGLKIFKREILGDTELTIGVPKLKGSGGLVFENLIIVTDSELVFEDFEKVELRNVRLKAEKPVRFINTKVELYHCDVVGCLRVENAKLSAENSEFHDSNSSAIFSVGSSVVLENCKITRNRGGTEQRAQVQLRTSEAKLVECEIAEAEKVGLLSENSKVSLIGCKVYKNRLAGIDAKRNSELYIERCDFHKNGTSESLQVVIEYSTALLKNSRVYGSDGFGICISNSRVSLIGCKIYQNNQGGVMAIEETELNIEDCHIYNSVKSDGSQVMLINSNVFMENSQIYNSEGTGLAVSNSRAFIVGCKIYKNNGNGVVAKEKTMLNMEYCVIYENGSETSDLPQVYVKDSRAVIDNSKIYKSIGNSSGVYVESGAVLLYGVKTYDNLYGVYVDKGSVAIYDCNIEDEVCE